MLRLATLGNKRALQRHEAVLLPHGLGGWRSVLIGGVVTGLRLATILPSLQLGGVGPWRTTSTTFLVPGSICC